MTSLAYTPGTLPTNIRLDVPKMLALALALADKLASTKPKARTQDGGLHLLPQLRRHFAVINPLHAGGKVNVRVFPVRIDFIMAHSRTPKQGHDFPRS
jgi:hypothetical protein